MIESHSLSEYLFGVAEEAASHGEFQKALKVLEQVLVMNPKHTKAWCSKEICLHNLYKGSENLRRYQVSN
jgi:hypothetical protein